MHLRILLLGLLALAALVEVAGLGSIDPQPASAAQYDIVEITALPASPGNGERLSMNNGGQITFFKRPEIDLYLFSGSTFTNINALPGAPPDGLDSIINDSGQIAFRCCNSPSVPGGFNGIFLFDGSSFTEITALLGSPGLGGNNDIDMNNTGRIAWTHLGPPGAQNVDIFLFDAGTFTNISDLPGGPGSGVSASINDLGQILFRTNDSAADIYLFDGGSFTNITDLAGGPGSGFPITGASLNNSGQAAFISSGTLILFDGSSFVDIKALPGGPTGLVLSYSLNDLGQLAIATGASSPPATPGTVLFFDGSGFDTVASGIEGLSKVVLNNNGQIAYQAFGSTGRQIFLATPVADVTPPQMARAIFVNLTTVDIEFNERLDPASAEIVGNYAITPPLTANQATLQPDGQTVRLATSLQTPLTTSTVSASNIKDLAGNIIFAGIGDSAQWTATEPSAAVELGFLNFLTGIGFRIGPEIPPGLEMPYSLFPDGFPRTATLFDGLVVPASTSTQVFDVLPEEDPADVDAIARALSNGLPDIFERLVRFSGSGGSGSSTGSTGAGIEIPVAPNSLVAFIRMTVDPFDIIQRPGDPGFIETSRFNVRLAAFGFPPPIQVDMDIKPGSDPNSISGMSRGLIPVAILSTPEFDAPTEVDKDSLTFGPTGDEESLAFCPKSGEDVNGDGLLDLVCHFHTQDTGFQCGDTEGVLRGETLDGVPVEGSDSVRIVPCR